MVLSINTMIVVLKANKTYIKMSEKTPLRTEVNSKDNDNSTC
jgi:hypothetical protein